MPFTRSKSKPGKSTPCILHLNLLRHWFDEIAARRKREEYREFTPFWRTRLEDREYDFIEFRNGYATDALRMRVQIAGITTRGRGGNKEFVIKLGRIIGRPTRKHY
jgi:hypothetical protein